MMLDVLAQPHRQPTTRDSTGLHHSLSRHLRLARQEQRLLHEKNAASSVCVLPSRASPGAPGSSTIASRDVSIAF